MKKAVNVTTGNQATYPDCVWSFKHWRTGKIIRAKNKPFPIGFKTKKKA